VSKQKPSKCHICKQESCGNDFHTRSTYALERNVGDRLKNILLNVYDMSSYDNLQINEIKALINNLIDEHLFEVDLANPDEDE